jgi:phage baseplate assembly protein W
MASKLTPLKNNAPQQIFYSDLPLNPTLASNGDISTVTNNDAIKQSLTLILNTNAGSRIFLPNYGARLQSFLFEPFDQSTATRIGTEIEQSINNYEQRIQLLNVAVTMIQANTSYNIIVSYLIINQQEVDTFTVTLQKL